MNYVYDYLKKLGYDINVEYYNKISEWIDIWKGDAQWLKVQTVDGDDYPMYSLGMAKRSCEDLASMLTSEEYDIKATKNDKLLQSKIKDTKLLEQLSDNIEKMGYTGTIGTVVRIKNAKVVKDNETSILKKSKDTKTKVINLLANQIIPLRVENNEFIDVAFVSEQSQKIEDKKIKIICLEMHILQDKGYQVTNVFFDKENGNKIKLDNILETYNTLSKQPLFSIGKLPKLNTIEKNMGLGIAIYGDAIDQLRILDLTYNNFGMDFKLGQKILLMNQKLTRVETYEEKDKKGNIITKQRVIYPQEIQKRLFQMVGDEMLTDGSQKPYVYEYNPDLRVGDNADGIQCSLDYYSFKLGYGTKYYSFTTSNGVTATEYVGNRQDLIANGNKNRKKIKEYLVGICKALLLSEKILGDSSIDETQEIEIPDVDNFLEDDGTVLERAQNEVSAGLMSLYKYLTKYKGLTEEEAQKEIKLIGSDSNVQEL